MTFWPAEGAISTTRTVRQGIVVALPVAVVLGIAVWRAPVIDVNDDQMLVAAYAQQRADPALYTRDFLLRDPDHLAYYTPSWIGIVRQVTAWCGDVVTALRVLSIALVVLSLVTWYVLLRSLSGSPLAASLVTLSTIAPRDIPYESWGVGGLGYAMPRSLGHALLPVLILWTVRALTAADARRLAVLGLAWGLLVNLHPPLTIPAFAAVAVGLVVLRGPRLGLRPACWLVGGFALGAQPFAWTYAAAADFAGRADPRLAPIVADYFAFTRPLTWFAQLGNWKVWAFDWIGPAVVAAYALHVARKAPARHPWMSFLLVFAAGIGAATVAGVALDEGLRRAGWPAADPEFVRSLRLLALPVFALAAFGVGALTQRTGARRLAGLGLAGVLLLTPPAPVRTWYYAAAHDLQIDAEPAARQRLSAVAASAWAKQTTSVDALFALSLVRWEEAALFRALSFRSVMPIDKDTFSLLHSDIAGFLQAHEFLMANRRAHAARDADTIVELASRGGADYVVVDVSTSPWFTPALPVAYSDGLTTVYVLAPRPPDAARPE